jgi:hypothetical protein
LKGDPNGTSKLAPRPPHVPNPFDICQNVDKVVPAPRLPPNQYQIAATLSPSGKIESNWKAFSENQPRIVTESKRKFAQNRQPCKKSQMLHISSGLWQQLELTDDNGMDLFQPGCTIFTNATQIPNLFVFSQDFFFDCSFATSYRTVVIVYILQECCLLVVSLIKCLFDDNDVDGKQIRLD